MATKSKAGAFKNVFCTRYILGVVTIVILILGVFAYVTKNSPHKLVVNYSHTNDTSFTTSAAAVSLAFQGASNSFSIGDTINLVLVVNSPSQAMNTVGGTILFDSQKLQLTNISKANSIISLWVEDPSVSISNSIGGSIVFLGGITSPGFIGNQGQIVSVSFKVIGTGNTSITVSNPQVLANDGQGTDLLALMTPSQIVVKGPIKIASTDINNDGKVDITDFSVVLSNYGKKVPVASVSSPATPAVTLLASSDFNSDGIVDIRDISILLSRFSIKK